MGLVDLLRTDELYEARIGCVRVELARLDGAGASVPRADVLRGVAARFRGGAGPELLQLYEAVRSEVTALGRAITYHQRRDRLECVQDPATCYKDGCVLDLPDEGCPLD